MTRTPPRLLTHEHEQALQRLANSSHPTLAPFKYAAFYALADLLALATALAEAQKFADDTLGELRWIQKRAPQEIARLSEENARLREQLKQANTMIDDVKASMGLRGGGGTE